MEVLDDLYVRDFRLHLFHDPLAVPCTALFVSAADLDDPTTLNPQPYTLACTVKVTTLLALLEYSSFSPLTKDRSLDHSQNKLQVLSSPNQNSHYHSSENLAQ